MVTNTSNQTKGNSNKRQTNNTASSLYIIGVSLREFCQVKAHSGFEYAFDGEFLKEARPQHSGQSKNMWGEKPWLTGMNWDL